MEHHDKLEELVQLTYEKVFEHFRNQPGGSLDLCPAQMETRKLGRMQLQWIERR